MNKYFLVIVVFISVAACSSAPENRYYTLSSVAPDLSLPKAGVKMAPKIVALYLPDLLDRPQFVVRTGKDTVKILEYDRWAEALQSLVDRCIAQDLIERMKGTKRQPDRRLSLTIDAFIADETGVVSLNGHWIIAAEDTRSGKGLRHDFAFTSRANVEEPATIAAAMDILLGQLADDILQN